MTTDILVVGIGGQGVMTAAEALARAALAAGSNATKTEVTGMSQRGGIVCSQVRIGDDVEASDIRPGEASLLIAFEAAEALRWCHYLSNSGLALVDRTRAVPPIVSSGLHDYPEDPVAQMRERGVRVVELDARGIARTIGDPRLANTVMLGAAAPCLPFAAELLRHEIVRRFGKDARMTEANLRAFDAGVEAGAAATVDRSSDPHPDPGKAADSTILQ